MRDQIENAKAVVARATEQLAKSFSHVPDDRLNWRPSETARSPIMIVAHCAESLGHLSEMLKGTTYSIPTMAEADAIFMQNDTQLRSREEALDALHRSTEAYIQTLDSLATAGVEGEVNLPFGLGSAPRSAMLSVGADHTKWHTAQLDYIHTIYGDRDWHA